MSANDLLLYTLPALVVGLVALLFYAIRLSAHSRAELEYRSDTFRLSIEKQIQQLTEQLLQSRARFESLNHLLLEAQRSRREHPASIAVSTSFFEDLGVDITASVDPRLVFVLTPFHPDFDEDYKVIKRALTDQQFTCTRGDDDPHSSNILPYVLKQVAKARLVIANISGRNPNVMYELGIAHAMGKPVLMVSRSSDDIPFDLASTRILTYEDSSDLEKGLRNWVVHSLARSA